MGASGNLMTAAYGMQAVNSVSTAYSTSRALEAQGDYANRTSERNARAAEFEAKDVIARGDKASAKARAAARYERGATRAQMAAQGIDVNSGSAADIQDDVTMIGEIEANTIKNNAWRQAFGLKVEAENSRADGEFKKMAAGAEARSTLVTGGLNAFSSGLMAKHYYNGGKTSDRQPTWADRKYGSVRERGE